MTTRAERVVDVLRVLSLETRAGRYDRAPVHRGAVESAPTPFRTVVGCLVSTRTRDEQTARVCDRLFAVAPTPEALVALPRARLERLLRGAGFYRQKARHIKKLASILVEKGEVPQTRRGLLELPGIGPKCANIVLATCFGRPAIAVDTHVHRISNRLGWVKTDSPSETEGALTRLVPVGWRRRVNVLLVAHGQVVCRPLAPRCDACPVYAACARRGVNPVRKRARGRSLGRGETSRSHRGEWKGGA